MTELHPYYQAHRPAMKALMRERLDLADGLLRDWLELTDTAELKQEIMAEFEIVLHQMPYVGGAESRMTDFFMRFLGLMAIGRVLRRCGAPFDVINEITLKSFTAQLRTTPEADRLEAGRQFMSSENRDVLRKQADWSRKQTYPADFVYELVEPGPGDKFEFGIDYRACGFCKFAAEHGDKDLLPLICATDFASYATRGIHLERTQTIAGGATHCNFRFSRKLPEESTSAADPE
jgi:hypothetical protein